jgi:hypothetical protein
MPAVTILANATAAIGETEPTPSVDGVRKTLVIVLVSGTAYWGWTSTVTASGATDAGIPLTIGVPVAFDAESFRFNATLKVFASADAVISYQENKHP